MAVNPDGVLVRGGDNGSLFSWRTGYNFQKAQTGFHLATPPLFQGVSPLNNYVEEKDYPENMSTTSQGALALMFHLTTTSWGKPPLTSVSLILRPL